MAFVATHEEVVAAWTPLHVGDGNWGGDLKHDGQNVGSIAPNNDVAPGIVAGKPITVGHPPHKMNLHLNVDKIQENVLIKWLTLDKLARILL